MKFLDSLDLIFTTSDKSFEESRKEENVEVLTVDVLKQLYYFSEEKLEIIYGHGKKRKVRIDNDPKAYDELYYFSEGQLEAIFGKEMPT